MREKLRPSGREILAIAEQFALLYEQNGERMPTARVLKILDQSIPEEAGAVSCAEAALVTYTIWQASHGR